MPLVHQPPGLTEVNPPLPEDPPAIPGLSLDSMQGVTTISDTDPNISQVTFFHKLCVLYMDLCHTKKYQERTINANQFSISIAQIAVAPYHLKHDLLCR